MAVGGRAALLLTHGQRRMAPCAWRGAMAAFRQEGGCKHSGGEEIFSGLQGRVGVNIRSEKEGAWLVRSFFCSSRSGSLATSGILFPATSRRSYSQGGGGLNQGGVYELKLAQTGEGIAECELVRWFIQEGEVVEAFQPVCEVQSDKASVEITSRYSGKIVRVHFTSGDIVKVGETLCDVLPTGATPAASSPLPSPQSAHGSFTSEDISKGGTLADMTPSPDGNVSATPAVRHLAKTLGIGLSKIDGSGKSGRILKDDVLRAASERQGTEEEARMEESVFEGRAKEEAQGKAVAHGMEEARLVESVEEEGIEGKPQEILGKKELQQGDQVILIRGYRRVMAKTMADVAKVPHFNFMEEVEMNRLIELREAFKREGQAEGVQLTFLPFMVKALSQALLKFPLLNSTVNENVTEIHCKASHNIGIAMATDGGLVVPNIKNCQDRSILEIAIELARLRLHAANNKLSREDVTGGTITISNVGTIGGTYATPLLNAPEVAIVALGRIQKLPRFDEEGALRAASVMQVSWSADHRIIDGATLASFCCEWKAHLEKPDRLLLRLK